MTRRLCFLCTVMALVVIGSAAAVDVPKKGATVSVRNETSYYLVAVYRATEGAADWGESILGEDVVVRPGKAREVRVPTGYAWVRAVFDVDGTEVEVVEEADFASGGEYLWTITEDMLQESYGADDDTYGYYDDTYGYYDDTYGYYDDTYGYY